MLSRQFYLNLQLFPPNRLPSLTKNVVVHPPKHAVRTIVFPTKHEVRTIVLPPKHVVRTFVIPPTNVVRTIVLPTDLLLEQLSLSQTCCQNNYPPF